MYFVYELVDPRNSVTGYVGITNNPNKRYLEHIDERAGRGRKYGWISSLQEEGIQPKMKILEIVDDLEQARRQERYWIQRYLAEGIPLVNTRLIDPTVPTVREEKRIFKMRPPRGYITATEAGMRLDVSTAMVWQYAQKGLIRYLLPSGMRRGFYHEKDVNKLARIRNTF